MKNIIFDIGNVLLSFHPEEFLSQYYDKQVMDDLMTIIFCSDDWIQLDLGNMTINKIIKKLSHEHPHYHNEITFVLENWTKMMLPIDKNVRILYQLKERGYPLYILSNFHSEAIQEMFDKYDFFQLFDGRVISAYEHVIKPSYKIYQILLDRYHLDAHQSLFIDDSLANIFIAQDIGIHGIQFQFDTDLEQELKNIGVL